MEPRATKTTENTGLSMVSAGLMWGWKGRPDSRPLQRHMGPGGGCILQAAGERGLEVAEAPPKQAFQPTFGSSYHGRKESVRELTC